MRRVAVERKGETNFFTAAMIKDCMKKVVAVNLHQVIRVDDELEIKAYYAGHVLGAAMFHIRVGNQVRTLLRNHDRLSQFEVISLLFLEPRLHRRLQHDPRQTPRCRMDRQVQARPIGEKEELWLLALKIQRQSFRSQSLPMQPPSGIRNVVARETFSRRSTTAWRREEQSSFQ